MLSKVSAPLGALPFICLIIASASIAGGEKNQDALTAVLNIESDAEYGAYLASECLTCHSPSGANGTIPKVHGKEKAYLASALLEYKNKQRANEVMQGIATSLSNEDIAALVTYLSAE